MKNKQSNLVADISFMMLLILLFACIVYIMAYSTNPLMSIAVLCVVFSILIITHFTSVTAGLIVNIIAIFLSASYLLYQLMINAVAIPAEAYFWMIMSPVMTVVSSLIFRYTKTIEEENERLARLVRDFSIINDKMGLKNKQAYEMEYPVYAKISQRYQIHLLLIVWEFRFDDDLRRMLGKENLEQVAIKVSKAIEDTFRKEDVIYILGEQPYEWGTLLLTKTKNEDVIMERMRKKFDSIDTTGIVGKNAPRLEMRIGVKYLEDASTTALTLLEQATNRLQYDV